MCEQLVTKWKLGNKIKILWFQEEGQRHTMAFMEFNYSGCVIILFEKQKILHNINPLCLKMKTLKGFHSNGIN
jgi:hypothetical protein